MELFMAFLCFVSVFPADLQAQSVISFSENKIPHM